MQHDAEQAQGEWRYSILDTWSCQLMDLVAKPARTRVLEDPNRVSRSTTASQDPSKPL